MVIMAITATVDGCVNPIKKRTCPISELKLLLTDKCNLSCVYCPVVKGDNKLAPAVGFKGIKDFLEISACNPQLNFSGGEPLTVFPTLSKLVDSLPHHNLTYCLTTNGSLTTSRIAAYLKSHKFEINVSIDGDPKSHNRYRKLAGKGSFFLAQQGLNKYMQDGYPAKANLVFTKSTVSDLVNNLKYISGMGVHYIDIQGDITEFWQGECLSKAKQAFDEFVNYYIALYEKNLAVPFMVPSLKSLIDKKPVPGSQRCSKVSLLPDGKYYICDRVIWLPQEERAPFCIGKAGEGINIVQRKAIFKDLFHRIHALTSSHCQGCTLSQFCPCPVGGFIVSRKLGMRYEEYFKGFCALSKIYLKSYLRILSRLRNNPVFLSVYR